MYPGDVNIPTEEERFLSVVPEGDVCDEESCADRPEMCRLAYAFRGRFRQEISRRVCTALGADTFKVLTGLCVARQALLAPGRSFTGRGQGDPLSLRFTLHAARVRLPQKGVTRMMSFKKHLI